MRLCLQREQMKIQKKIKPKAKESNDHNLFGLFRNHFINRIYRYKYYICVLLGIEPLSANEIELRSTTIVHKIQKRGKKKQKHLFT